MQFSIFSKKLNETFDFWMSSNGGYVYLELPDRPGTLGQQILNPYSRKSNGYSTIRATPETFENECRKWLKRKEKNS